MKKKLLTIILMCLVLFHGVTVFAVDPKSIFTEVRAYNARIYVCDTENTEAILLNVTLPNGTHNTSLTGSIEYRALPIVTQAIFGSKGQKLTMDVINGYLLDSPVRVLIGKNGYGYKILCMEFLK